MWGLASSPLHAGSLEGGKREITGIAVRDQGCLWLHGNTPRGSSASNQGCPKPTQRWGKRKHPPPFTPGAEQGTCGETKPAGKRDKSTQEDVVLHAATTFLSEPITPLDSTGWLIFLALSQQPQHPFPSPVTLNGASVYSSISQPGAERGTRHRNARLPFAASSG